MYKNNASYHGECPLFFFLKSQMITEQSVSLLAVHQIKGGWRRGTVLPPPEASSAPLAVLRQKVSIKKVFFGNPLLALGGPAIVTFVLRAGGRRLPNC